MLPAMQLDVARSLRDDRTTRMPEDVEAYARWEYRGGAGYHLREFARAARAKTRKDDWAARARAVLAQVSRAVANAFSRPSESG